MFIVIEGIDGTGKSTQARRLAEWFRSQGREVVLDSEPTRGPHGMRLRESFTGGRLSAVEELALFLADREEHVAQVIAPALAAGKVVILDRYYFSNMAYQGAIGFDPQEIRRCNETFAPVPDLLFILDLDPDTALARIGGRGEETNEFENRENLERCRSIFLSIRAETFARVIDVAQPMEEVQERLRQECESQPTTGAGSEGGQPAKSSAAPSKVSYQCTECRARAWDKPGLSLICGKCFDTGGEIVRLEVNAVYLQEKDRWVAADVH